MQKSEGNSKIRTGSPSMKKLLPALIAAFLSQSLCAAPKALIQKYEKAVHDAAMPEQSEISDKLDAVSPDNASLIWNEDKTKLKVVTWKSQDSYEKFLKPNTQTSSSESYVIWITLAPKMKELCSAFLRAHPKADKKALDARLKELLGLNPSWEYDVFVELWVSPEDLFRPCVDPIPNDSACDLSFGQDTPKVKNIKDYKAFYQNLYFNDFHASPGVPWTGLGYTYDWGNPKSEVGLSEFILSPSSPYTIEQAVPTEEYCRP
jgi:hypothetical protein